MQDGYKVTFNFTIRVIGEMRLENHLRLLLRFNILFSVLTQKRETHHSETEEEEKG